jgi:hypothetical protein
MNTLNLLQSFPPILVRLLARRKGGAPLSDGDIAAGSGLELPLVSYISQMTDWGRVSVYEASHFCRGCGLSWDDAKAWRRVTDYLRKRPTFKYLSRSDDWQSLYKPMFKRWLYSEDHAFDCPNPHVRALVYRLINIEKKNPMIVDTVKR